MCLLPLYKGLVTGEIKGVSKDISSGISSFSFFILSFSCLLGEGPDDLAEGTACELIDDDDDDGKDERFPRKVEGAVEVEAMVVLRKLSGSSSTSMSSARSKRLG